MKRVNYLTFLGGAMVGLAVLSVISFAFGVAILIAMIAAILASSWLPAVLLGLLCFVIFGTSLMVFSFSMYLYINSREILEKWDQEQRRKNES
jgi:hypothetical protein